MAAQSIDLKAIIGLGNPGPKYTETRHNAGFWFVEQLAGKYAGSFRHESRFMGELAECFVNGSKLWCHKPATFMNLSGQAVRALSSFYRLDASQILVAHDEIDLPPGVARLKFGGGHGGHNGLRDIISHLGTRDFYRLRIGVGHPGSKEQVADYVLKKAGRDEQALIDDSIVQALDVMPQLVQGELEKAMQVLHTQ